MSFVDVYKSLADESRLRILHTLGQGSFNVQELTSIVELSQPTVSHHLKILQKAGLIRSHKEGTWVYYGLGSREDQTVPATIARNFLGLVKESAENDDFHTTCKTDSKKVANILQSRRDKTHDFFESVAHRWDEVRVNSKMQSYLQEIQKRIPADATLLELGCGAGALFDLILPRAGECFGVDYSEAMIKEAKKNLGERAALVDLRLGHLEHLPFGDSTIDYAVAHMVFHHLPDPRLALEDVFRVLRPGGTLILVDLVSHKDETMRDEQADLWLGFDVPVFQEWAVEQGFVSSEVELLGDEKDAFVLTALKNEEQ